MKTLIFMSAVLLGLSTLVARADDALQIYQKNCAECHGADRLGGMGPALLPENLHRLRKPAAVQTILKGRPATQMAGFADKLSTDDVDKLVKLIYTPPAEMPAWGLDKIKASHIVHNAVSTLPD